MKIIAFTGVHGSGKSTLVKEMEDCYTDASKTVYVVHEVARKCPYKLGTVYAQEYIWHNQMEHEKYAMRQDVDVIICDRTVLDNLIYYYAVIEDLIGLDEHMGMWHRWGALYQEAINWSPTYTSIVRLPLNLEYLKAEDDIRPKSVEYALRIDKLFTRFVQPFVTGELDD